MTTTIALDAVVTTDADQQAMMKDLAERGLDASIIGTENGYPIVRLSGDLDVINKARLEVWGDGPGGICCDPCPIGECCSWFVD